MNTRDKKINALYRLINHPATPPEECEAAKLALDRLLRNENETKHLRPKVSVAKLFSKRMSELR